MSNTVGTGYDYNYNETYCLHRLPCGYCQILKQLCPITHEKITITYAGQCAAEEEADG